MMTEEREPSLLHGASRAAQVAVAGGIGGYGGPAPYSPDHAWPEYPFPASTVSPGGNPAYEGVRSALALLNLDAEQFETPAWNPLGEIIRPGETVVVKPNFVREFRDTQPGHEDCVITHGAVLRAVLDYVYMALGGRGRIVVADAPHNDADFGAIGQIIGLDTLSRFYHRHASIPLEIIDLRPERAEKIDGVIVGHTPLPGDPAGYVTVDLGADSAFHEVRHLCHLLYGSEYDAGELHRRHHDDVHEYRISKTVLNADVVISLPKLKTHKKTGLTVNLKNLVGINGNKNWLPHHREGTPSSGGDQFADDGLGRRIERCTVAQFKRVFPWLGPWRPLVAKPIKWFGKTIFGDTNVDAIRSGNWHGNDTTWRMVHDLNRILMYADSQGRWHNQPVRRFFSVVDGIVAGEGNGPMDPTAKAAGIVLAGFNPVAVDLVCARLMGFDFRKLPLLHRAFDPHARPLADFAIEQVKLRSKDTHIHRPLSQITGPVFAFQPHFGWRGHVEIATTESKCVGGHAP
jgi:uncharacterized protein (DUF362 family)